MNCILVNMEIIKIGLLKYLQKFTCTRQETTELMITENALYVTLHGND